MTSIEIDLAFQIVKENFGDIAKQIVSLLVNKKSCTFMSIAQDLNLEKKLTSQILTNLINHHIIEYKLNSKQIIEYKFFASNALNRLRLARSINSVRDYFNNDLNCELILREISLHGNLEMSSILLKILATQCNENVLKQKLTDLNAIYLYFNMIRESFVKLVKENFLERMPQLDDDDDEDMSSDKSKSKVPIFLPTDINRFLLPDLKIDELRMKKSIEEDFDTATCKIKRENENLGDNGIHWKINEKRIIQLLRDEVLIEALENRLDNNAGKIIRSILNLADAKIIFDKAQPNTFLSRQVTAIDLNRMMINQYKLETNLVEKYLTVILQDSFKLIEKIGDFSGGAYCIDFKKALTGLSLANIESYVRERYGSKSLRIFRVILEKIQLEQKQIEDFSMIPSKECKSLLYDMLNDGFLSLTELSKTSDHAPSRTFYLFYIDVYSICRKLLENSYKAIFNLMLKREHLIVENKRLLEKNQKINVRIDLLKAQGAGQAEIDEEKAIMSSDELIKLNSFTAHCNKIELAEIQIEETIFIFETYFYYHTVAPALPAGKNK